MFNTLKDLIGLRIDDEKMISFLEANGFKYPKKATISNRSTDTSYWVQNKKLGIDLLFEAQNYLDRYPLIQGEKKGIFVPILNCVRWYSNKSKTTFPHNLDFGVDFQTLNNTLGAPTLKSSEISPVWLNDDGSESFYRWDMMLDPEKSISWGLEFNDEQEVKYFKLGLTYSKPLIQLYYQWSYETYDSMLKRKDFYVTADLFFLRWAIDRNLANNNGNATALEWVRSLNRGYITEADFTGEHAFMHAYIKNLSGHDILYTKDAAYAFLDSDELKQNYFGAAATERLNEVAFNDDNYAIVKSIIDTRLQEYTAHQFSKSKKA